MIPVFIAGLGVKEWLVPHPVFWTQVFIKPPEIERLGRATGLGPARG